MARTEARRRHAARPRPRRLLAALSASCLLGGILTIGSLELGDPASAAIPSSFFVVKDQNGPNDQPGQVDLTELGRDTTTDPSRYDLFWSWDSTDSWTGTGQTGDACALFDYDGDGNVDAVICGEVHNPGNVSTVVQTFKPFAFRCVDAKNDRCNQPTSSLGYPVGDVTSGPLSATPPTGNDLTSNLISATDPFLTGDNYPNDTVLRVSISKAYLLTLAGDLGTKYKPIANPDPTLVNVCSYPSAGNGGNNNPFDCIAAPGSGFLVIKKDADGAGTFPFTVNPVPTGQPSSFSLTTPSAGGTVSTDAIGLLDGIGTEGITETIPSGWRLTDVTCTREQTGGSTGTATSTGITGVTIDSGKTTTCTFTDRKIQTPTLQTDVTGSSAGGNFAAHGTDTVPAGTAINDTVQLTGGAGTVTGTVDFKLFFLPGAPPSSFTNACSGTAVATETGKTLVNGLATSQSVSTTLGQVGTYVWQDVYHPASGSAYSGVTETCGDERVTAVEGRILLTPHSDTDPVGDTHTLTLTVQWTDPALASSTTWPSSGTPAAGAWSPVSGASVYVTLNPTSHASFVGLNNCTTSSAGTCTVSITDSTVETVTIHASSTFSVAAVHGPFVRFTTVGANCTADTCDATKIWVPIPPSLLTDVTGSSVGGTFTAHATDTVPAGTAINDTVQLTGIAGPVTGTVDFNLYFLPGAPPSSFANACSGTAFATDLGRALVGGVATSQAFSTTVGKVGTYVWQDVYHPAAGSPYSSTTETCGDETVTTLAARILLTPHSATDAVGDNHTVTATVQWTNPALATALTWPSTGDPAAGAWSPVSGAIVMFSLSGTNASFVGGPGADSCATNGAGACSVTITDSHAETVTIHAQSTFSITGVHGGFTRFTTVGSGCTADTCDATKTFITVSTTLTVTDQLKGLPQVANGAVSYRSYTSPSSCAADTTNTGGTSRTPSPNTVLAGAAPSSTPVSVPAGTEVWFRATYTSSGTDHIGSFTTGCVERVAS